jgi:muramoyltetrapeptide carboxypeptidase
MNHAPRLIAGDTIGIVSPGRWMPEAELQISADRLRSFGFNVFVHRQNSSRHNQFAGDDDERAEALTSLLTDNQITAVMFAKGGYGTLRIIDHLDYGLLANHQKIVVGYSDATALLLALHIKTNLITFHGPMLYDLREAIDEDTWSHFLHIVSEGGRSFGNLSEARILRRGTAQGRLLGGNLSLLVNLIGTSTDFDTRGALLFIEDYDEAVYALDRMLLHLRRSGKLSGLGGLIVGSFSALKPESIPFGATIDDLVLDHCRGMDFPIVAGFPLGHQVTQRTLPIGAQAMLHALSGGEVRLELLERAVG